VELLQDRTATRAAVAQARASLQFWGSVGAWLPPTHPATASVAEHRLAAQLQLEGAQFRERSLTLAVASVRNDVARSSASLWLLRKGRHLGPAAMRCVPVSVREQPQPTLQQHTLTQHIATAHSPRHTLHTSIPLNRGLALSFNRPHACGPPLGCCQC
jgi:hypothetical protein